MFQIFPSHEEKRYGSTGIIEQYIGSDESRPNHVFAIKWWSHVHGKENEALDDPYTETERNVHNLLKNSVQDAIPWFIPCLGSVTLYNVRGYVMPWCHLGSIGQWLRHTEYRNPNTNIVLRVFRNIVWPVSQAHKIGIVHNKLNPDHFLIHFQIPDCRPLLTDWAMAKPFGPNSTRFDHNNNFVRTGITKYTDPSVISDNNLMQDHRSDIYSLGKILQDLVSDEHMRTNKVMKELNIRLTCSDRNNRFASCDEVLSFIDLNLVAGTEISFMEALNDLLGHESLKILPKPHMKMTGPTQRNINKDIKETGKTFLKSLHDLFGIKPLTFTDDWKQINDSESRAN